MEYLLPPLEPRGHVEADTFHDFFNHSSNDLALMNARVLQLRCPHKEDNVKERMAENVQSSWWEIGGADDFDQVTVAFSVIGLLNV